MRLPAPSSAFYALQVRGPLPRSPVRFVHVLPVIFSTLLLQTAVAPLPCAAQSLGDVARQEREKRANAAKAPGKILTEEDLRKGPALMNLPIQARLIVPAGWTITNSGPHYFVLAIPSQAGGRTATIQVQNTEFYAATPDAKERYFQSLRADDKHYMPSTRIIQPWKELRIADLDGLDSTIDDVPWPKGTPAQITRIRRIYLLMPAASRQYIFTFAPPAHLHEQYLADFELLLHSFQPN